MKRNIRFPAEFEPHEGTLLIWPERPGSWGKDSSAAEEAFLSIIRELAKNEKVYLMVSPKAAPRVREAMAGTEVCTIPGNLVILAYETDDSWARDTGPTFVYAEDYFENANDLPEEEGIPAFLSRAVPQEAAQLQKADPNAPRRMAVNWCFNAWGGEVDGLYASWEKDDAVAKTLATYLGDEVLDASPFVLEGGSIHTDGEGTLLVTESCLLSAGRNPELNKEQIEEKLKEFLGVEKVLWLPRGIYMDETNEHVDNVAAFVRPGEVVLAWTDNPNDPQYELSQLDYAYLSGQTDAKGRKLAIHRLPIPDHPVCVTEKDLENLVFEPGEDEREVGERLAASYVNFYFANEIVLVPQFGGENEESDARAVRILRELCPDRRVVPIYARPILLGGGNIHCITQQVPRTKEYRRKEEQR